METFILDNVMKTGIPEAKRSTYGNELVSLSYLAQGLNYLNMQVLRIEEGVLRNIDPTKRMIIYGNHPTLRPIPQGLVASAFHWYAVSACNFVRLVGWLIHDEDCREAQQYVKAVMPPVKMWRDKVGAHFARVKPEKRDSLADLTSSVMFPIAFDDTAFWTGSFNRAVRRSGQSSSSRTDMRWSLTDTHRQLSERYGPTLIAEIEKETN